MSTLQYIVAFAFAVLLSALPSTDAGSTETASVSMRIDDRFPGGNIVVERIDGDEVHLRPDLRDTEGWWFYGTFACGALPAGR